MRDTRILRYLEQLWVVELDAEPQLFSRTRKGIPRRVLRFRLADVVLVRDAPDDRELEEFTDEELLRLLHGEEPTT